MISLPVIMNELIIIKYYVIYFTDTFLADDITLHIIMVRIAYETTIFDYKGDAYYDIKCQKVPFCRCLNIYKSIVVYNAVVTNDALN